jgi:drug/metabolite transporter (DMT)-like permease
VAEAVLAMGWLCSGHILFLFRTFWPELTIYQGGAVGVGLALVAALLWGGATVFGRFVLNEVPFPLVTALRFAIALPFLAIAMAMSGGYGELAAMSSKDFLYLVIIMLGPGFGAMFLYYFGLKVTRASVSALLELTWP